MKTPSKHSRDVLVPATLLEFSLSALCPTAVQAQSPQPASKGVVAASSPQQPSQPAPTLAAKIDRQVGEVMPEDKCNFTPESQKIPGSDYQGVLTFAGRLKHVAVENDFIWSTVTGDKLAEGLFNDGSGPDNLKTKPGDHSISERFVRAGSQGRGDIDAGKHAAGGPRDRRASTWRRSV